MKNCIFKIVMLLVSVVVWSCESVHNFPNEDSVDPTLVNVDLTLKFDTHIKEFYDLDIFHTRAGIGGDQTLRMVIEIYKYDNQNKVVQRREIILNSIALTSIITETFQLKASKYKVVAWVDYVNNRLKKDQFYNTKDGLRLIKFIEPHRGNTDQRDAFWGCLDVDLTSYRNQWNVDVDLSIELNRPMAKYVLITNDIEEYIVNVVKRKGDVSTKMELETRSDIDNYTAKIFYLGFTPNGFDAYGNQLNDAKTGLIYTSDIEILNNKEAVIGFDYPLANGPGSKVVVGIQIYDKNGELINEIDNVEIPITRGDVTIIRSDFLTRQYSSGIVIDPDYDGVIDVILPN